MSGMEDETRFDFAFVFDRPFLHRAHWRDYYWQPLLVAVLAAAWLVYLHFGGGLTGNLIVWAVAGTIGITLLSIFLYWLRIERTMKAWAALSPDRTFRYSLTDDAIICDAGTSKTRVEWGDLFRVWIYGDVWILEVIRMQSLVFPPSAVSPEAQEFILERCRDAGKLIIQGRRILP